MSWYLYIYNLRFIWIIFPEVPSMSDSVVAVVVPLYLHCLQLLLLLLLIHHDFHHLSLLLKNILVCCSNCCCSLTFMTSTSAFFKSISSVLNIISISVFSRKYATASTPFLLFLLRTLLTFSNFPFLCL